MKTFFIWLLLSFISLQGFAANAVLTCQAANQAPMSAHSTAADDAHAHPCAALDPVSHASTQADGSHDNGQEGNAGCVAKYVGVSWLHTAELALPSIAPLPNPISFAAFHLPFFIPDGPERPPRRLFL